MARKTLLTEGEIRQFMKLANLGPLGNEKIQEMGGMPYNRDAEEEAMGDELSDMDSEADREGDEIDDLEGDLDVADDEIADDDMDMSGIGDDEKETLMADVVQAVADALGISDQVSIEAGSEGGEDLDALAVDDEEIAGVDAMAMEPEMGDMGGEEEVAFDDEEEIEDPMMEKHVAGHREKPGADKRKGAEKRGAEATEDEDKKKGDAYIKETSEDDIVAEVAKRVAARLQQDNERDAMVEKLAERIMKRLTK